MLTEQTEATNGNGFFDILPQIGRDPILGLNIEYEADTREEKVNGGVGVVTGEDGMQYMPNAIRSAMPLSREDENIGYISPSGEQEWLGNIPYLEGSIRLAYGDYANELINNRKVAAVATAGGSRAISHLMDAMKSLKPNAPFLLSSPSWPVHSLMREMRDVPVITYDHMNGYEYNLEGHLDAIKASPQDTTVVFHTGRSHNPTGVNPQTPEEWEMLAEAMEGRLAFFDTAYAGLVDSLIEDTEAIRIFQERKVRTAVALSYSKNAGLYKHRTGALIIPAPDSESALKLQRFLNHLARGVDSSPPATGQETMANVFSDPALHARWQEEMSQTAELLKMRRNALADEIPQLAYLREQAGLYALLPLNKDQVRRLKEEFAIYILDSGRINIGGIPLDRMPHVVSAMQEVLNQTI